MKDEIDSLDDGAEAEDEPGKEEAAIIKNTERFMKMFNEKIT
jgi:hypothetical protein